MERYKIADRQCRLNGFQLFLMMRLTHDPPVGGWPADPHELADMLNDRKAHGPRFTGEKLTWHIPKLVNLGLLRRGRKLHPVLIKGDDK